MPAAASEAFSDYRKFAQDAFHNNITLKQTKHLCSEDVLQIIIYVLLAMKQVCVYLLRNCYTVMDCNFLPM